MLPSFGDAQGGRAKEHEAVVLNTAAIGEARVGRDREREAVVLNILRLNIAKLTPKRLEEKWPCP